MASFRKGFKYGCIGCLGALGLAMLLIAVVSTLAFVTARPEQIETRVLTPTVPSGAGRVVLEIRGAELHVERAAAGEPLRVEARYDTNAFALDEELVPGVAGPWILRLKFGKGDRPGVFAELTSLARGSTARIDVYLPNDQPIDFALDMKQGGAVLRLGGLWLTRADVDFAAGAFELDVDEPLRQAIDRLTIRTNLGGALINNVGNASPRRFDVTYGAGGIDMGLAGQWVRDADINIHGGLGGGVVHLPHGVNIEGLDRGRIAAGNASELETPTLTFSVSSGIGRLEFANAIGAPRPTRSGRGSLPPS